MMLAEILLANEEHDHEQPHQNRYRRKEEDALVLSNRRAARVRCEYPEQQECEDRAEHGDHIVRSTVKTKGKATFLFRYAVCEERVSRGTANALSRAIRHAYEQH